MVRWNWGIKGKGESGRGRVRPKGGQRGCGRRRAGQPKKERAESGQGGGKLAALRTGVGLRLHCCSGWIRGSTRRGAVAGPVWACGSQCLLGKRGKRGVVGSDQR